MRLQRRNIKNENQRQLLKICLSILFGIFLGTQGTILFSLLDSFSSSSYHHEALTDALNAAAGGIGGGDSSSSSSGTKERDGWKSIDIFYGDTKHLTNKIQPPDQQWFGQVLQDKLILDLLQDKIASGENGGGGYFIDLAANDALEFSNTYALEKYGGWNGLCIEPNPVYWFDLSFRKCQVVGALVGGESGKDELTEVEASFRGVFGGIVGKYDEKLANRKREPKAEAVKRFLVPFDDILQRYNVPKTIDYLSLDVEGAEYLVMKNFPFDTHRISLMTVERPDDQLKELFQRHGYIFLKQLVWWGETLWAHESLGYTPDHPKIAAIVEEKP